MVPEEASGPVSVLDPAKWLRSHGVQFSPAKPYPVSQIDEKESRKNQVRPEAIIPEAVERYAARFRAGEVPPPLVAYKRGGKAVLIDGNNREAGAKKAGVKEVPMIFVDPSTSSEMMALLMAEANSQHGIPTEQSWRDQQALNLVDVGWSVDQAAKSTGLTRLAVETALRVREIDDRAAALGVRGFSDLSKTARNTLGRLKADPVFQAASRMVIETQMGAGTELSAFVRDVRMQPSESASLAFIGSTTEERIAVAKRAAVSGRRLPSPKHEVLSALGAVKALAEKRYIPSIPVWFISPEDRKELRQRIDLALNVLADIEGHLDESPPVAP